MGKVTDFFKAAGKAVWSGERPRPRPLPAHEPGGWGGNRNYDAINEVDDGLYEFTGPNGVKYHVEMQRLPASERRDMMDWGAKSSVLDHEGVVVPRLKRAPSSMAPHERDSLVPHEYDALGDLGPHAFGVYSLARDAITKDALKHGRPGYVISGKNEKFSRAHAGLANRAARNLDLPPGYSVDGDLGAFDGAIVHRAPTPWPSVAKNFAAPAAAGLLALGANNDQAEAARLPKIWDAKALSDGRKLSRGADSFNNIFNMNAAERSAPVYNDFEYLGGQRGPANVPSVYQRDPGLGFEDARNKQWERAHPRDMAQMRWGVSDPIVKSFALGAPALGGALALGANRDEAEAGPLKPANSNAKDFLSFLSTKPHPDPYFSEATRPWADFVHEQQSPAREWESLFPKFNQANDAALPWALGGGLTIGGILSAQDQADAMPRARVPKLPMDEASRMARAKAQGFDVETPLFHGTRATIEGDMRPSEFSAWGPGIYATTDAEKAARYATLGGHTEGSNILPLLARSGEFATEGQFVDLANELARNGVTKGRQAAYVEAARRLADQGYLGVRARNNISVFDPSNIRSRFAKFDPEKSGSSDLLASAAPFVGGGAALAAGLNSSDADAARLPRVPKQPKLPSTALDWAAEDARGAAREAARAKGIVPRGGADGGGAAAFDLFGDRAGPLVQATDDALTVTPRGGAIPTMPGRIAPRARKIEALSRFNEKPLLTRPGVPEGTHVSDQRMRNLTLTGGAIGAGAGWGFFGPSLTENLQLDSKKYVDDMRQSAVETGQDLREADALSTMESQNAAIAKALEAYRSGRETPPIPGRPAYLADDAMSRMNDALMGYRGMDSARGGTLKAPGDTVGSVTSNLLMGRPAYHARETLATAVTPWLEREQERQVAEKGPVVGGYASFAPALTSAAINDPLVGAVQGVPVLDSLAWFADNLRDAWSGRVGRGKGELERMRAQAR